MAYAAVQDMIERFGAAEMVRLSTPDGEDMETVVAAPVESALDSASALIDSYLRKRYRVPLDVSLPELREGCMKLARYGLAQGGDREPSAQMKEARDETVSWLRDVSTGKALLDLEEIAPGDNSFAQVSTRSCAPYGATSSIFPGNQP